MYSGVNTFVWRKFDIPANQQPMKLPDGLQVFQVPSKGEGLQTLNPINQGEIVHSGVFELTALNEECMKNHCGFCLRDETSGSFKCCRECEMAHYCSNSCRESDLKSHSLECKLASKIKPNIPTRSQRLLLRLLAVENGLECEIKLSDLESFDREFLRYFMSGIALILKYIPECIKCPPQDLILKSCQLKCSCFEICGKDSDQIGIGYSQILGKLNHSCCPNCSVESMGIDKSFSLVALEGISPGQEVY